MNMCFNLYTVLFIILAVFSNLIIMYVFHQGVLAYIAAVVFLLLAAYSTKPGRPQ
ncbi:hypothetical protein P4273_13410 [Bacillus swezeyi]|uniref:hypothetical protein n=2 Tax=Bacillus swezeyi TaxID=1925020 RepID=UPI002E1ABAEF|nr:hypothetical protein [Bacillus swezeyi]